MLNSIDRTSALQTLREGSLPALAGGDTPVSEALHQRRLLSAALQPDGAETAPPGPRGQRPGGRGGGRQGEGD